jgi:phosphopantetheinyl transferase (holo-ACP synthase)
VIGNDVVDLRDSETLPGARHPRFDARVFTAGERSALERSGARDRLRWILWAAKESAFKVARRREPDTAFAPIRFVADLDASLRGCVRHANREYPVRVAVTGDCVHAVATEAPATGAVRAGVAAWAAEGDVAASLPGRAARELAAAGIAPLLGVERADLRFVRRGRVPELQLDPGGRGGWDPARRGSVEARLGRLTVSLSHHGRFVAYACWLPQSGPGVKRS